MIAQSQFELAWPLRSAAQHWLHEVLVLEQPSDKVAVTVLRQVPSSHHSALVQVVALVLRKLNLCWFVSHNSPLPPLPLGGAELQQMVSVLCQPWSEPMLERLQQASAQPALWDGCPAWLDELGQQQPNWPATRAALSEAPTRFIRANRLKTTAEALKDTLAAEGIQAQLVPQVPTALEITSDGALFKTAAFQAGLFEQQDAGSQLVALQLDVKPGMRVIDACAGAGGKSLLLAAQMQGRGRVLAMDIEQWKLDALQQRANRAGAGNIETRLITSSKTIKRLADSADRLLLDVPCSGSGVLKRNPEGKWRHDQTHFLALLQTQADILRRYSKMLKPGGTLVYATCSVLQQENQQQIQRFLAEQPEFTLQQEHLIDPAQTGWDGFYWAVLVRNSVKASNKPAVSSDN